MLFRAGMADNVIVPFNAKHSRRRDVILGEIPRKSKTFCFQRPFRPRRFVHRTTTSLFNFKIGNRRCAKAYACFRLNF